MAHCEVDQAVFYVWENGVFMAIVAHVDDLTIVTSSVELMVKVKDELWKEFKITDMVHWAAVKRVFAYLAGTVNLALMFGGTELDLEGYTDADGSMDEDRKAMSGYAFLMDGGVVLWNAKKQEIIALSTTEAEYVAATHAAKEGLWLCTFMNQVFGTINTMLAPSTLT
ncbi:hypothetical protein AX14_011671 [Amanita brunnescens Koide BX004]|nr:hypothetical protein AX14_011671 [Amanita brunnescens Koide BX004]